MGFDLQDVLEVKSAADWQLNTHISVKNRYVFFQVCKAASSTVTYHLQAKEFEGSHWRVQNPSNKHLSPHLSPFQLPPDLLAEAMTSPGWHRVTFVRNPFTRLLSCYLHRIVAQSDSPSARYFRDFTGDEGTPSFRRFVEVVCSQSSREMERHWRVQADESLASVVELDFVGRVERLQGDLLGLSQHLFGEVVFDQGKLDEINASPMQTNAGDKLEEHYTGDLARMVADRFAKDFEFFGYSTDLGEI